ncbi:DNA helicase [Mesorhizobium australicum]|uniref:AAA domain-containing protein n=1 Tax=Mesorhizobium australicum TaxID=536018 RepID=A0A1X7PYE4_9HYPH|nr:DNA helicase [Mesorhizobium australicum]SMH57201.1 AAA domain-containing protein [Mesorhizobium australicum]
MKLTASIPHLKRKAKLAARSAGLPLHAALDGVAREEGFASWSLLAARHTCSISARELHVRLRPGDLVLVGARPGQGKTLLSLELAVEAAKAGHRSVFFTLEYTMRDVLDRLRAIGVEPSGLEGRFEVDLSDAISADHVMKALAEAPRGALAVIDYLQLLDQRRDNPDLATQVRRLKAFAADRGVILVFISQIDRAYDAGKKSVPDWSDVRLPNPLDLALFDRAVFLNGGEIRLSEAA